MTIIYDILFLFVAIVYSLVYLFKGKFHQGFLARLGFLPNDIHLNHPIWIHAVSVGEVASIKMLVGLLKAAYPDRQFVISTVTPTGNRIARGFSGKDDFVTYLPFDLSFIVKKVIDRISPSLFIIVETELWPNLITFLNSRKIPVVVVNARISDRSFGRYRLAKLIFKPLLNKINLFCAQSDLDAGRLIRLGVREDKIKVTGNVKFDMVVYEDKATKAADLSSKLGIGAESKFFVAGSTHPQEEEIILSAYKKILPDFPYLKLLIAPRHPERSAEIGKIISGFGFQTVYVSKLESLCARCIPRPVFVLDVIGRLMDFYQISDIVFVGGSLVIKGGHNILEPASLGKPILSGQHMFNFRDIAELFLRNNAIIVVHNDEEIAVNVRELLNDASLRQALGSAGRALILQNKGATARNLELIRELLR